ncbi:hypothetical protein M2M59_11795 [Rummeliibacillus sp. G93]|uniref:hypothetical protein n=1 Tax=Rummeliibacillus sp. G93 TaxID=2939494 RepID=UPI00201BA897|nr:hypothetical protein [Rummeliibacillus sp. G93]UQW96644.1 hypothetical protein M2M59_11795 [Rummeliibacillus sp. G93]
MPWTKKDYPASMKNLETDVRNKAIEIANALLDEGYEEGRAIAIATAKAHEYVEGSSNERPRFEAKPSDHDWVLKKSDSAHAIFTESSKEDLLAKGKPYVNKYDGILDVYYADGKLEHTLYE